MDRIKRPQLIAVIGVALLFLAIAPALTPTNLPRLANGTGTTLQLVVFLGGVIFAVPVTGGVVAGAVGTAASSVDGAYAVFTAVTKNEGNAAVLDLAVSIVIDMIVFPVSMVAWPDHLAITVMIALAFALIGWFIAASVFFNAKAERAVATYSQVSFTLSSIGLGVAGADALSWL